MGAEFRPAPPGERLTCEHLRAIVEADSATPQRVRDCDDRRLRFEAAAGVDRGSVASEGRRLECAAQALARAGVLACAEGVRQHRDTQKWCMEENHPDWDTVDDRKTLETEVVFRVPRVADEWVFIATVVFGNLFLIIIRKLAFKGGVLPADQLARLVRNGVPDAKTWEGPAPIACRLQQQEQAHADDSTSSTSDAVSVRTEEVGRRHNAGVINQDVGLLLGCSSLSICKAGATVPPVQGCGRTAAGLRKGGGRLAAGL